MNEIQSDKKTLYDLQEGASFADSGTNWSCLFGGDGCDGWHDLDPRLHESFEAFAEAVPSYVDLAPFVLVREYDGKVVQIGAIHDLEHCVVRRDIEDFCLLRLWTPEEDDLRKYFERMTDDD